MSMLDEWLDTIPVAPAKTLDYANDDPLDWPLHERPRLYLAGYYTANPAQGVANSAQWFQPFVNAGWLPIVPHVNILLDMLAPQTPDFWYAWDRSEMETCAAIFVCPDYITAHSAGVLREIGWAEDAGMPVLYDVVKAKDRYAL